MAGTELAPTTSTTELATSTGTELVAGWLLSFRSENTRQAYRGDLAQWAQFCADCDLAPLQARRGHVDAWARTLEAAGARPATVARKLGAVASFYRYCVSLGLLESSPTAHVTRPRTGEGYQELTPALDADELGRLAAVAVAPRDRVLVLTLVLLGLRISEALALNLDALETVRGHQTLLVQGKGGRVDRLPVPPLLVSALADLAAAEARTAGPVFATPEGARWNRYQANRALARLGRRAGLPRTLRPHMLRATCITRALDLGATLRDVQDHARHADPRTTRRYDRGRGALDRSPVYALAADLAGVS